MLTIARHIQTLLHMQTLMSVSQAHTHAKQMLCVVIPLEAILVMCATVDM